MYEINISWIIFRNLNRLRHFVTSYVIFWFLGQKGLKLLTSSKIISDGENKKSFFSKSHSMWSKRGVNHFCNIFGSDFTDKWRRYPFLAFFLRNWWCHFKKSADVSVKMLQKYFFRHFLFLLELIDHYTKYYSKIRYIKWFWDGGGGTMCPLRAEEPLNPRG